MSAESALTDPIQAPGTPEHVWRAWRVLADLPRVEPLEVAGAGHGDGLVVVAAHPDDEILGAGRLIAAHLDAGIRVRVVLLTDGEKSHPGGPIPPELLRERRVRETQRAMDVLGPACEIVRLALPDTGVGAHQARAVDALAGLVTGAYAPPPSGRRRPASVRPPGSRSGPNRRRSATAHRWRRRSVRRRGAATAYAKDIDPSTTRFVVFVPLRRRSRCRRTSLATTAYVG
ncbi:PIG-L deacetylase family protein [Embleya hyalina]|uniref:PIG-L deacetylase family protein n=1 Tax=Embleya hyalina TaxID=516124 RepID=UPI0013598ACF|nr:PIG-L family deacetylase [Embleya hyalina]